MKFTQHIEAGVEWITAELEPGELVYDASRDAATFHLTFNGQALGQHLAPREWMAMARAMVEGVRSARESRAPGP
jgi:hypothetical protein